MRSFNGHERTRICVLEIISGASSTFDAGPGKELSMRGSFSKSARSFRLYAVVPTADPDREVPVAWKRLPPGYRV